MLNSNFQRTGILFVLSAPSGSGKTTLCSALRHKPDFVYAVSCTTRAPRPGEIGGEDYHFLSDAEFDRRMAAGEFLEYAEVHGRKYGTLKGPVIENLRKGIDVLIDIDTKGAANIRACSDPFILEALADVFIMPPNLEELRRRLVKRAQKPEQIITRLQNAAAEMERWRRIQIHAHQRFDGGRHREVSRRNARRTLSKPQARSHLMKTIVLGVCGSIAAYKSADLTSKLVKRGHSVSVVMTANATQFIGAMTFQTLSKNPVTSGVFDERESWRPTHIDLADRADLFLIAPATANVIAKVALGISDDALTSIALATRAPFLIAPAMNGKMWLHPATQQNATTLRTRGAEFIGPEEGMLACGYEGVGRLWNVDEIVAKADEILLQKPTRVDGRVKSTKKIKRKSEKIR
jgi:guanylate kinase